MLFWVTAAAACIRCATALSHAAWPGSAMLVWFEHMKAFAALVGDAQAFGQLDLHCPSCCQLGNAPFLVAAPSAC